MGHIFLGFDPGGIDAFGWCVLYANECKEVEYVAGGICSNAREAINMAEKNTDRPPAGIGIDSPMYWSPAGDRAADRLVRKQVIAADGSSGTVGHVNSLRGACLAQGVMVGCLARQIWDGVPITESHPKALLRVWPDVSSFTSGFALQNDHERDAAIGAYSALAWFSQTHGWRDLRQFEEDPFDLIDAPPPVYWFPVTN